MTIVKWFRDLGPAGVTLRAVDQNEREVGSVWPYSQRCWRGRLVGHELGFDAGHGPGEAKATLVARAAKVQAAAA